MKEEFLIRCIERQLGQKSVRKEDRFIEDLGAESIDMLHIIVEIESQTGIFVPEEVIPDLIKVKDLFEYINNHQG